MGTRACIVWEWFVALSGRRPLRQFRLSLALLQWESNLKLFGTIVWMASFGHSTDVFFHERKREEANLDSLYDLEAVEREGNRLNPSG